MDDSQLADGSLVSIFHVLTKRSIEELGVYWLCVTNATIVIRKFVMQTAHRSNTYQPFITPSGLSMGIILKM